MITTLCCLAILFLPKYVFSISPGECFEKLEYMDSDTHIYSENEISSYENKCWVFASGVNDLDGEYSLKWCLARGGFLTTPESEEENNALGTFLSQFGNDEYRLGMQYSERDTSGKVFFYTAEPDKPIRYYGPGYESTRSDTSYSSYGMTFLSENNHWGHEHGKLLKFACEFRYEPTVSGDYVSILPEDITDNGENEFQGQYEEASQIGALLDNLEQDLHDEAYYQQKQIRDAKRTRNDAIAAYDALYTDYGQAMEHINSELYVIYQIKDLLGDNISTEILTTEEFPIDLYEDAGGNVCTVP